MSRKLLYLGNGSWCYTENCRQHQEGIHLQKQYLEHLNKGDIDSSEQIAETMMSSPETKEALLRLKVQEMRKRLGRAPTVGLDFDGTVADFTHGMRTHLGTKYRIPRSEWEERFPDPDAYNYYEGTKPWFRNLDHFLDEFHEAERNGMYRKLRLVGSPNSALIKLKGYGFRIIGTTARTDIYNADTISWLKKKRIPVERVIHTGPRKSHVQNVDVFIEDSPKVLADLYENSRPAVIKTQDYNLTSEEPAGLAKRIHDWDKDTTAAEVVNLAFSNTNRNKK